MSAELKRRAAEVAVGHVEGGMRLGLGTGSTAEEFVKLLGARVADGLDVVGVPTSERTAALAGALGIRLSTLDETPELDLTVDGADEIGPRLALVKGGGGALLREKIVAAASRRMIVIADVSKVVATLGAFPLPIEVVPFGLEATRRAIAARAAALGLDGPLALRQAAAAPGPGGSAAAGQAGAAAPGPGGSVPSRQDGADAPGPGGSVPLRQDGAAPYLTDGGHFILDASFRRIPDPEALARALAEIPGVVEHGLFIGLASLAVVARADGTDILQP